MNKKHTLITEIEKAYIRNIIKEIEKINTTRNKFIDTPNLSNLEFETLIAIANGKTKEEIEIGIKNHNMKYYYTDSYTALTKRILKKLEARTLAHAIYKAMKNNIIN